MSQRPDVLVAGRYRIVRPLGSGGAAAVHLARDETTGQEVAIKRLRSHDPAELERFRREAMAARAVRDSHVVALLDSGVEAGRPWIALELVRGGTLADLLNVEGRLDWRRAAALAAQVASGLAAIHAAGLVHRDVKPGNVLLTETGVARLSDFGLVRAAAAEERLTRTGEVLGTLEYLSPEQANAGTIDARTDLYGLGALLFALLTGRAPFEGSGVALLRAVLEQSPPSPRELARETPPELERLVRALLAKNPVERGTSAAQVARELEQLATAPLPAKPTPTKPADDEPATWAALLRGLGESTHALVAVVMLVVFVVGGIQKLTARPTPSPAPSAARPTFVSPAPMPTRRAPTTSPTADALEPRFDSNVTEAAGSIRTPRGVHLVRLLGSYELKVPGEVAGLVPEPDGANVLVATVHGSIFSWNVASGRLEHRPRTGGLELAQVAVTSDRAVVFGADRSLHLSRWRPGGEGELADSLVDLGMPGVWSIAGLPGHRVLIGSDRATIATWDADTGELKTARATTPITSPFSCAATDASGKVAITAGITDPVVIWDLASMKTIAEIRHDQPDVADSHLTAGGARCVAVSADGRSAAWGLRAESWVQLRELATGKDTSRRIGTAWSLAFSRDGKHLFAGGEGWILDCDVEHPDREPAPRTVRGMVGRLATLPDGSLVAGLAGGGLLHLSASLEVLAAPRAERDHATIAAIAVVDSGSRILAGDVLGRAQIWDVASGEPVRSLGTGTRAMRTITVSPDGGSAVVGGEDRDARVFDLETGRLRGMAHVIGDAIAYGALIEDERTLLTVAHDGNVGRWGGPDWSRQEPLEKSIHVDSRGMVHVAHARTLVIVSAATDKDGVSTRPAIHLISTSTLTHLEARPLADDPTALALAPDEKRVFVGGISGTLTVLDVASFRVDMTVDDEPSERHSRVVAIAAAATVVATAHHAGRIVLRDATKLEALGVIDLTATGDHATAMAFSRDGHRLHVGTARGVILVFTLE